MSRTFRGLSPGRDADERPRHQKGQRRHTTQQNLRGQPFWLRILQDTKGHPEILQEIEKCKADYYLQHPGARNADLADFQDVSLVNIESLRSPLETLPISSFIRNREQAVHFLDLD